TLWTSTDPTARVVKYGYTQSRFSKVLTQISDEWDRIITTVSYDAQGRVQSYTDANETWTYEYAYSGDPYKLAKRDSNNNLWVFTFNTLGEITSKTPPQGYAEQTVYGADGAIQQTIDGSGVVTAYTYDGSGQYQSVTRDATGSLAVRFDYTYD